MGNEIMYYDGTSTSVCNMLAIVQLSFRLLEESAGMTEDDDVKEMQVMVYRRALK